MILTCPACETKYVIKDGAIPPGGRQVRCASCKHSWHQDPDPAVEAEADEQSVVEAAIIEPRGGPEMEERAYEEAVIAGETGEEAEPGGASVESEPASPPERDQWAQPEAVAEREAVAAIDPEPADAAEFEPFYEPEIEEPSRRRVPMLLWVLLVVAALAAAAWFLAPQSVRERLGLNDPAGSQLEIMVTNSDRQRLASGNELFAVSGRVINPTDHAQKVPPLKAELLDRSRQKVVYSWTIEPPAAILAPGDSASFNSAEVDVPEGGSHLRVTLEGSEA